MTRTRMLTIGLGISLTLAVTVVSAYAAGAEPARRVSAVEGLSRGAWGGAAPAAQTESAALAACSALQAGPVAWVILTDDNEIESQVESYDSGTSTITPVFEYNCVPKKVKIVTVFSLNGETVFTDQESLRASNSSGLYGYPLGTTDDSPLDDGEWGVEFFNNKTLLTSGLVTVGEGEGAIGETVTVEGTVKDKKTRKPIKGAVILVLQPGITVQDFVDRGQKDADVFTAAQTDSRGQFVLENPLERNVAYSIVVVAKGYKPLGVDGSIVDDEQPDPVQLDITMTR